MPVGPVYLIPVTDSPSPVGQPWQALLLRPLTRRTGLSGIASGIDNLNKRSTYAPVVL
ncbi:hypothetical protein EDB98_1364 [Pseudomonas fluorescens]|nr:hypothetical protein EDB98_1364 [Pseudomonas fluorescens]SFW83369.1 hypothetical protein SAMN03159439_05532 [Pseudomonas sp. NFACC04-2]